MTILNSTLALFCYKSARDKLKNMHKKDTYVLYVTFLFVLFMSKNNINDFVFVHIFVTRFKLFSHKFPLNENK